MSEGSPPRWRYRFANLAKAILLLEDAIAAAQTRELSMLEQAGLIQHFEFTWELAWHTLRELLDADGIVVTPITPLHTIRAANEAEVIENGDEWMAALKTRNKLAHIYSLEMARESSQDIVSRFAPMLIRFTHRLESRND